MTDSFTDELGEVKVTGKSVERERSDSGKWEDILDRFDSTKLADRARFSEIEELRFQPQSRMPTIEFRLRGKWRKMMFVNKEVAEKVFKRTRYRRQAYLQNR